MEAGKWYHNPVAVLLLIFFVLGPFGLPLLWKSPRFSKTGKQVVTALTLLHTGFLLWMTGAAVYQTLQLINEQSF